MSIELYGIIGTFILGVITALIKVLSNIAKAHREDLQQMRKDALDERTVWRETFERQFDKIEQRDQRSESILTKIVTLIENQ